jgi:hypothetical protein
VTRTRDQQRLAAFRQNLVANQARVELISEGQIESDVLAAAHAAPVDRRIAQQHPQTPLVRQLLIRAAHRAVELTVNRRYRPKSPDNVPPSPLHLSERHILAGDVAVDYCLVSRVSELHHDVVHPFGESGGRDKLAQQIVLLPASMDLAEHNDAVGVE